MTDVGTVLVTGGVGRVGRAVVERLVADGMHVRVLDRLAEDDGRTRVPAGVGYVRGDINDYRDLLAKARGCARIVHLAAVPAPHCASADEIFRIDTGGTFNVFRAAEELGITRVVQASSINALGHFFGMRPNEPRYFPIDEDHPTLASDAYSLSKRLGEELGDYHWRRSRISSVALRFPMVLTAETRQWTAGWNGPLLDRVLAMDRTAQRRWLDEHLAQVNGLRAAGMMERPDLWQELYGPNPPIPPEATWLLGPRMNYWAAVDVRDAAQAVAGGLTAGYDGAHALFICGARNVAGLFAETLVRAFYPEATTRTRPLVGNEALVSSERAGRLIGYRAVHEVVAGADGMAGG